MPDDAGQEPLLLVGAAEVDQRGAEQALTDQSGPAGPAGTGVLLVKDHLEVQR